MGDQVNALSAYGISYTVQSSSQTSWSGIKKNINSKYPISASCYTSKGSGHSVLVYGYRTISTSSYIVFWNPGTAATQIVYYKSAGSTFTYNSTTYTWPKSLSKK